MPINIPPVILKNPPIVGPARSPSNARGVVPAQSASALTKAGEVSQLPVTNSIDPAGIGNYPDVKSLLKPLISDRYQGYLRASPEDQGKMLAQWRRESDETISRGRLALTEG